jgi:hypothetical protein
MSRDQKTCWSCGALLTPAELEEHAAAVRETDGAIEHLERSLAAYALPEEELGAPADVPDTVPPDMATIAEANEELRVPDHWFYPQCYACQRQEAFLKALRNPDGWTAEAVTGIYYKGYYGCAPNPVMAYSWALVALSWWRQDDAENPHGTDNHHLPPLQEVLAELGPRLSDTERQAADDLAADVFEIWQQYEEYYARLLGWRES